MALRRSTLLTLLLSMTFTVHLLLVDLMALFTSGMVSTKNDSVSSASKQLFASSVCHMIYCSKKIEMV